MAEDRNLVRVKMEVDDVDVATSEEALANPDLGRSSNLEPDWSWKRVALQSQKFGINVYNRFSIIKQIKEVLQTIGAEVYQQFVDSCFGHFMEFHAEAYSCNAALHALMAREIKKMGALDDEIWFHIGDQTIRFSKYEYALVTGLRFGDSMFNPNVAHDPPAGSVYSRCFNGETVSVDTLRATFTEAKIRQSPADALKLAKVLFLYCMLFGVDTKRSSIDRWVWALVEDADRWENFPWGKYTFQILLRSIRNVPISEPEAGTGRRHAYHFYGFSIALLIWAYEAIPQLGNTCAERVSQDAIPRCLRWRLPKRTIDMVDFFDNQMPVFATLAPNREEQQRGYWRHIDEPLASGIQYIHRGNPFRGNKCTAAPTTGVVEAWRPKRSMTVTVGPSKRARTRFSASIAAAFSSGNRCPSDVQHPSTTLEHGGDVSSRPTQEQMGTAEGADHGATEPEDVHDIPFGSDWLDSEADFGSEEQIHDIPVSAHDGFLTRLIQRLTPIIRQEIASALELHLPTIVRRELSLFCSHRDFPLPSAVEQPSPGLAGDNTAPSGIVPALQPSPPSSNPATTPSEIVPPSTSYEPTTLVEQLQLSPAEVALATSSSVAEKTPHPVAEQIYGATVDQSSTSCQLVPPNTSASHVADPAVERPSLTSPQATDVTMPGLLGHRPISQFLACPFRPIENQREVATRKEFLRFLKKNEQRNVGLGVYVGAFFMPTERRTSDLDYETICLLCGDKGFTNAFVYCVKCLEFAVHRYCLDVIPRSGDAFVHWVCDDCEVEVQNQPAIIKNDATRSKIRDGTSSTHVLDARKRGERSSSQRLEEEKNKG